MPDKPIKNEFKFWVLGASFNGVPVVWEFNQCKTDVCYDSENNDIGLFLPKLK